MLLFVYAIAVINAGGIISTSLEDSIDYAKGIIPTTLEIFRFAMTNHGSKIPVPKVGFKFKLSCSSIDKPHCDLARWYILTRQSLQIVGNRIANELILKRPIHVLVKFRSLDVLKNGALSLATTTNGPNYRILC